MPRKPAMSHCTSSSTLAEQPTETMPDAGSPAHLFLYAASAYAIYNLVSSTMRDPLSWWNPPAIGGPHSREVAGRAAELRRAASQPPSQTLQATPNKPLRRRSARMAMQARLHTRQRRRPRDHRHGPSARQDHHPNTNIHPASNPANHACSTTTLRWPPPRAAHQSLFRRKDGGTSGWSTSRRPSANARGSASGKMTAVRRERGGVE